MAFLKAFYSNEMAYFAPILSLLPLFFGGRKEASRKLSFEWKILIWIGHYSTLEQCISYQVLTQVDKISINQSFILEYLLVLRLLWIIYHSLSKWMVYQKRKNCKFLTTMLAAWWFSFYSASSWMVSIILWIINHSMSNWMVYQKCKNCKCLTTMLSIVTNSYLQC